MIVFVSVPLLFPTDVFWAQSSIPKAWLAVMYYGLPARSSLSFLTFPIKLFAHFCQWTPPFTRVDRKD